MNECPLKILVLEDHAFQRACVVAALRKLGCTNVFEASDGVQALAMLKEIAPVDITICDLQMEGMDGVEFLYKIANSALIRSVVISSTLPLELRRSVQKIVPLLGMHLLGDIGKPFNIIDLEKLLSEFENFIGRTWLTDQQVVQLEAETEVRRAFAANEFVSYYQPKFNLQTGEVLGAEVLVRWLHPTKGLIVPSSFIPVLEKCNLMNEFFFEQLNQSLILQKQVLGRGYFINMALNIQGELLGNSDFHSFIGSRIAEHGLQGSGLTFELAGSSKLDINPSTLGNLYRLRMLGCKLSIDNFGCGYSSLQRLYEFPFNEIKIDSRIVQQLKNDPRCLTILSSTLALGASLGMSVIIEGIETPEQRLQLLELGCTVGQGYLYAGPMSDDDLLQWLDTHQSDRTCPIK